MTSQRGQSTVEMTALLPALVGAGLVLLQVLAAGMAAEYADHAAEAGAVAILQGRDPARAARAALPSWSTRRMEVAVSGRRVRVRVQPAALADSLGARLAATSEAHAGPPAP